MAKEYNWAAVVRYVFPGTAPDSEAAARAAAASPAISDPTADYHPEMAIRYRPDNFVVTPPLCRGMPADRALRPRRTFLFEIDVPYQSNHNGYDTAALSGAAKQFSVCDPSVKNLS